MRSNRACAMVSALIPISSIPDPLNPVNEQGTLDSLRLSIVQAVLLYIVLQLIEKLSISAIRAMSVSWAALETGQMANPVLIFCKLWTIFSFKNEFNRNTMAQGDILSHVWPEDMRTKI